MTNNFDKKNIFSVNTQTFFSMNISHYLLPLCPQEDWRSPSLEAQVRERASHCRFYKSIIILFAMRFFSLFFTNYDH